jgi:carbon-monoxide dehydrogenase catalytic subunit
LEDNRISHHASVRAQYKKLKADGMDTIWDRYEAQGLGEPDQRCPFCMGGNRCDLCSNGPCRADASKDKRGVCGITADGMAMRMMLLRNIMGASTYQYHAETTIETLRLTALEETPYQLRDHKKLMAFAERLGIDTSEGANETALELCSYATEEFNRPYYKESDIVGKLAPEERKAAWRSLNIFPGGIHGEMMLSTSSCLTNVDGYYASLALKAMRLSIAMAYQSQILNEYCQDILFGTPKPHTMRVDLGVLDPQYVNVLPNGHEPFVGFAMADMARETKWQNRAKDAGAKGLRVIANIEAGQEMIQRYREDDVFYGFTGNWIAQEAVLSTGAVDLFAADMNCSMPIDPLFAQKYQFELVPVSDVVAFEGITERMDYRPAEVDMQADLLLKMAIDNFPKRREKVSGVTGLPIGEAVVGFSAESIVEALGGTLEPLLDAIRSGDVRGIAGLVSCTSLRDSGQDVHSVEVAKKLIANDVLVLSMGCGNAAMQVAGLCSIDAQRLAGDKLRSVCEALSVPPVLSFGTCTDTGRLADLLASISAALGNVPVPDLPVAAVAPEYMEQKATIDAIFALALGLYTYVNPVPTVTNAPKLVDLVTSGVTGLTGGRMALQKDADEAVAGILAHIDEKRKALGI